MVLPVPAKEATDKGTVMSHAESARNTRSTPPEDCIRVRNMRIFGI